MSGTRICQHCGGSLAGKRSDAKFCGVNCRDAHFKHRVGRTEAISAQVVIDRQERGALIEAGKLNMQDEHDTAKVREALYAMCEDFVQKYT